MKYQTHQTLCFGQNVGASHKDSSFQPKENCLSSALYDVPDNFFEFDQITECICCQFRFVRTACLYGPYKPLKKSTMCALCLQG